MTKKDPGTQFTTQFACFTSTKVHALEKLKSVTKKDPGIPFTNQFTCFTSTKVQKVTPERPAPPQFTCFTGTKVQTLTPEHPGVLLWADGLCEPKVKSVYY